MWVVTVVIFGPFGNGAERVRTYGPYGDASLAESARRRLHMEHIMPLFNASQRMSFTEVSELQEEEK